MKRFALVACVFATCTALPVGASGVAAAQLEDFAPTLPPDLTPPPPPAAPAAPAEAASPGLPPFDAFGVVVFWLPMLISVITMAVAILALWVLTRLIRLIKVISTDVAALARQPSSDFVASADAETSESE